MRYFLFFFFPRFSRVFGRARKKGRMEGGSPSNGGLLYHEVQESKLCAVHCVNTVLQGPFFSELDLAALASDLDQRERQMMLMETDGGGLVSGGAGDFLSEDSHNVSMGGDFSIQVLEKALEVWDLHVIPLDSPVAEPTKHDPEMENAYICHLLDHWFCIRKVNGEWYNFNSLYAAPEHLTKFYLSAYLDSRMDSTVVGGANTTCLHRNFSTNPAVEPKSGQHEGHQGDADPRHALGEQSMHTTSNWIMKPCNQKEAATCRSSKSVPSSPAQLPGAEDVDAEEDEAELLNTAIQASLMEPAAFISKSCTRQQESSCSDPPIADAETRDEGSVSPARACTERNELDAGGGTTPVDSQTLSGDH